MHVVEGWKNSQIPLKYGPTVPKSSLLNQKNVYEIKTLWGDRNDVNASTIRP